MPAVALKIGRKCDLDVAIGGTTNETCCFHSVLGRAELMGCTWLVAESVGVKVSHQGGGSGCARVGYLPEATVY